MTRPWPRRARATCMTPCSKTSAAATGRRSWCRPAARVHARVIVREAAVLCGRDWFDGCVHALDGHARVEWLHDEGAEMAAGSAVCEIESDARALLSAERPALNFLQLLSGTATVTRRHVRAIEGASPNPRGCAVLDTRKTIPGLRQAQKYAVRVGGGQQPASGPVGRHPDQGEPHRGRRWRRGRARQCTFPGRRRPHPDRGRDAGAAAPGAGGRREQRAAGQLQHRSHARGGRAEPRVARCSRFPAALLSSSCADIAATGVDRISIGKLTKDVHGDRLLDARGRLSGRRSAGGAHAPPRFHGRGGRPPAPRPVPLRRARAHGSVHGAHVASQGRATPADTPA